MRRATSSQMTRSGSTLWLRKDGIRSWVEGASQRSKPSTDRKLDSVTVSSSGKGLCPLMKRTPLRCTCSWTPTTAWTRPASQKLVGSANGCPTSTPMAVEFP